MDEYMENSPSEDLALDDPVSDDPAYEASASDDPAYEAAKELAESYTFLLKQKESYRGKLGKYPHYTLDDAYYLLTQGAHEQMERVQTSGTSDPVSRAVMNTKFMDVIVKRYIELNDGNASDVYVIREGQKLKLDEVVQLMEEEGGADDVADN